MRQADKTGDGDDVLEPGETWVYTCKVAASQIFTGDVTQVINTVTVNAKDQRGQAGAAVEGHGGHEPAQAGHRDRQDRSGDGDRR